MTTKASQLFGRIITVVLTAACLSVFGVAGASDDSQKSVTELIDELTQIDSQSPGINSAAVYDGFIPDASFDSFLFGIWGVAPPTIPPQMRELVRRGPAALPELIRHLDDSRETRFEVGNKPSATQVGVDRFFFMYFSDEYDPRKPTWFAEQDSKDAPVSMKGFEGRYKVKVGDACYVLIGQIVNRRLRAVRYQPSGGLIVNSPIEAPVLVARVRNDWSQADAEVLRVSLLDDVRATNQPKNITPARYTPRFVDPALARLRFYFPETYKSLEGTDLQKRNAFEKRENKKRLVK